MHISFVSAANNNTLTVWRWSPTSLQQTPLWGHPVTRGTSPSAEVIGGAPHLYFVDAPNNNTITDFSWNPTTGWQQTPFWGHPVAAGTSPCGA
jgi:hypothetical protein